VAAVVEDETAESELGISTHRAADRLGLRRSHQQGCRTAHSRREVQTGAQTRVDQPREQDQRDLPGDGGQFVAVAAGSNILAFSLR